MSTLIELTPVPYKDKFRYTCPRCTFKLTLKNRREKLLHACEVRNGVGTWLSKVIKSVTGKRPCPSCKKKIKFLNECGWKLHDIIMKIK